MEDGTVLPNVLSTCHRELSILFKVAETLTRAGSLESLATGILNEIISILDAAETGALYLYDKDSDVLKVKAAYGYRSRYISGVAQKPGEGIVGKSFETGQQILLKNQEDIESIMGTLTPHNQELLKKALPNALRPRKVLCTPLILDSKPIGALILENFSSGDQEGLFEELAGFVQALCNLISISIGKVFLQRELENTMILKERERMKSELVDLLSHEIRTPLSSIKGYVSFLLSNKADLDREKVVEYLKIIDGEVDLITTLITEILDSAAIEAGAFILNMEPVLLSKIAEKVVRETSARTKRHKIVMAFSKDFPVVMGDRIRLEQVMRNLLDNAVKYSDGGLIVVKGVAHKDEVVLSVADQGIGIKPEHLNRLFDRYYRIKNEGKQVVGTGLGLPIARAIVEGHGGRIWASSHVGRGTTFYFTLPIRPEQRMKGEAK